MPDPDEVFEEAEGTEVQDLLTQLYAAVDRLKDNPKTVSYTHLTLPTSDLV